MAATKTYLYTGEEKNLGMLGRALSHPARIRILKLIEANGKVKNCELVHALELSKKAVHDHLKKLQDASLIRFDFHMNSYVVTKEKGVEKEMIKFLKYRA